MVQRRLCLDFKCTIGVNKEGHDLFVVNSNGERDTRIDNKANEDVDALLSGNQTKYSRYVPSQSLSNSYIAVPTFSGNMSNWDFEKRVQEKLPSFSEQLTKCTIEKFLVFT